jgi:hypothetical protein
MPVVCLEEHRAAHIFRAMLVMMYVPVDNMDLLLGWHHHHEHQRCLCCERGLSMTRFRAGIVLAFFALALLTRLCF